MSSEMFLASAKYNDFVGSAAADCADNNNVHAWLNSNGYLEEGESLVGLTIFSGENMNGHEDPISVKFILASPDGHENVRSMIDSTEGPIPVRCIRVSMKLEEFFGLFKRFSIAISSFNVLADREYISE